MKGPRLKRDWYGRTIELLDAAASPVVTIPAGTRLVLSHRSTKTRGAMYAEAPTCASCGCTLRVLVLRADLGRTFRFVDAEPKP